ASIPTDEFDRSRLLAAEKESIGLFVSTHPLREVGPALIARADCALSELGARRDGEWVTVGGMLAQAKRIRTKKGDPMMFATLDDLEGSVELVIFGKALAAAGDGVADDSIVLVRGRIDHKDRDRTCLVAQQIDPFEPTPEEVQEAEEAAAKAALPPPALRLRLDAAVLPESALRDLKELLGGFPGEAEVVIEQRLHDPPCLLDHVLAREVRAVAVERGLQEHLVRRGSLAALRRELHVELDHRRTRLIGAMGVEQDPDPRSRIDPEHDLAGLRPAAAHLDEVDSGRVLEDQPKFGLRDGQPLAGADEERDARPAPV